MYISKEKELVIKARNFYTSTIKWKQYKIHNKNKVDLLKKNAELKGKYCGKRCFILGNGPSLSDIDFELLTNEYVFTVNQISRKPGYENLNTNFHFWADPAFFRIDTSKPEDLELLETMKTLKTKGSQPLVFFPINQEGFVHTHGIDSIFDVYYFKSDLTFLPSIKTIDYTKTTPGFGTVVQWCITMAVYMGFSEIYLLGCDNTSIVVTINSKLRNPVTEYAYTVSANERTRMEKMVDNSLLYRYAYSYTQLLLDYIHLYEFTQEHNIKLVNCTDKSAIDLIPYKSLSDVLELNTVRDIGGLQ